MDEKHEKIRATRAFRTAISGVMLSSALVGSLLASTGDTVFAAGNTIKNRNTSIVARTPSNTFSVRQLTENMRSAPYYQFSGTELDGQRFGTKFLSQTTKTQVKVEFVNGEYRSLENDVSSNANGRQQYSTFEQRNKVYSNSGKGWTLSSELNANQLQSQIELQLESFRNAKVTAIKSGHKLVRKLSPSELRAWLAKLKVDWKFNAQLDHVTYTIETMVVGEKEVIKSETVQANFENAIIGQIDYTFTYNKVPIISPLGLPEGSGTGGTANVQGGTIAQGNSSSSSSNNTSNGSNGLGSSTNNSSNSGANAWTNIGGSPSFNTSLLYANDILYVGTGGSPGQYDGGGVWTYKDDMWTQMKGSPDAVYSLLYVNGTLYAGTDGNGVWTYINGKWSQLSGLQYGNVSSLLYVDGTLYAGTFSGDNTGVWEYNNGTWRPSKYSTKLQVYSLMYANDTLYAGTESGVWQYSNGEWTRIKGSPNLVDSLLYVKGTLYAASGSVWMYKNGTWTVWVDAPEYANSLLSANGILYEGTGNRQDPGSVWTYIGKSG